MNEHTVWHLVGALFLVALNAFFVASEFAIVKIRRTRLQKLVSDGDPRAKVALHIVDNLNAYLTANQLGITLASLGLGWIGKPAVAVFLNPLFDLLNLPMDQGIMLGVSTVLAFMSVTFMHTVLGELVPKSMAILSSEAVTLKLARPLHWFYVGSYPLIYVLNGSANLFVKLLGYNPDDANEDSHSVEELRMIFWAIRRRGEIDESTEKLLTNLLDYQNRTAREVMTPRNDVIVLDPSDTISELFQQVMDAEFTRYPMASTNTEPVMKYVHIKDVVRLYTDGNTTKTLHDITRNAPIVPESIPADRVRRILQRTHNHMAFVVDEFGDFAGVVTMEDLLEEIVGQIQDELDREAPEVMQLGKEHWLVDARILLEVAERELGLDLQPYPDGMDTLAGYILTALGRMAKEGDITCTATHELKVIRVDGLRVRCPRRWRRRKERQKRSPKTMPNIL